MRILWRRRGPPNARELDMVKGRAPQGWHRWPFFFYVLYKAPTNSPDLASCKTPPPYWRWQILFIVAAVIYDILHDHCRSPALPLKDTAEVMIDWKSGQHVGNLPPYGNSWKLLAFAVGLEPKSTGLPHTHAHSHQCLNRSYLLKSLRSLWGFSLHISEESRWILLVIALP